jgi:hypothetical protein
MAIESHISSALSQEQWRILRDLHLHYQEGHDLLSQRELMRLRFLRWLVQTGRLSSQAQTARSPAHATTRAVTSD